MEYLLGRFAEAYRVIPPSFFSPILSFTKFSLDLYKQQSNIPIKVLSREN